jgi:hypothetical protein
MFETAIYGSKWRQSKDKPSCPSGEKTDQMLRPGPSFGSEPEHLKKYFLPVRRV